MIYLDYSANTPVDETVLERFCAVQRELPPSGRCRRQNRHRQGHAEHCPQP